MKNYILILIFLIFGFGFSQTEKTFIIDGLERKALFFEPTIKSSQTPVVFVFHGHFGTAKHASKTLKIHEYYPEALVVYMQGIPGAKSKLVDKEGKYNGWQMNPSDLEDRDVKFFDEVLSSIKKSSTVKSLYAIGHSNGSRFVNVLWKMRGNDFSAFITVAGPGGFWMKGAVPKPVWISYGKDDQIVSYKMQNLASKMYLKFFQVNEEKASKIDDEITLYKSQNNQEIIIENRNGGHEFPQNSIPKMIDFLKRNP